MTDPGYDPVDLQRLREQTRGDGSATFDDNVNEAIAKRLLNVPHRMGDTGLSPDEYNKIKDLRCPEVSEEEVKEAVRALNWERNDKPILDKLLKGTLYGR